MPVSLLQLNFQCNGAFSAKPILYHHNFLLFVDIMFLTSKMNALHSVYLSATSQLNCSCFNARPPTLDLWSSCPWYNSTIVCIVALVAYTTAFAIASFIVAWSAILVFYSDLWSDCLSGVTLVCLLWDSFLLLTPCNVLLCLIWWQMPHVLIYASLFLVLVIVCVSNKCMQLYTYASTIWHYTVIGWLWKMC